MSDASDGTAGLHRASKAEEARDRVVGRVALALACALAVALVVGADALFDDLARERAAHVARREALCASVGATLREVAGEALCAGPGGWLRTVPDEVGPGR